MTTTQNVGLGGMAKRSVAMCCHLIFSTPAPQLRRSLGIAVIKSTVLEHSARR